MGRGAKRMLPRPRLSALLITALRGIGGNGGLIASGILVRVYREPRQLSAFNPQHSPKGNSVAAKHLLVLATSAVLALTLTGCGSGEPSVMPDVTGKHLDVAKSDIERAGYGGDIEVVGGGLFGVVDESKWTVCEQTPTAGADVKDPRLVVDRECGNGEDASPSPSQSPEPTASAPEVEPTDTTLAEVLDRLNSNELIAGEVYRFDAELMERKYWLESATGYYSVMVKVPGSTDADNQDFFVLVDDASQAADWVAGSIMTFVVENLELDVSGETSSGWLRVLSAEPAA